MSNDAKTLAKDIITELSDAVPGFDELWRKTETINRISAYSKVTKLLDNVIGKYLLELGSLEEQIEELQ